MSDEAATSDRQPVDPPRELIERLLETRSLLVTSHENPDGDAIGSELGLARALAATGRRVQIWNRDPVPDLYAPLAGSDEIHVGPSPPGELGDFQALLFLECPTPDRSGLEGLDGLPWINIDHHLGNSEYGELNWVDTTAAAVGEMVFALLRALPAPIDSETADALLLALVSDTGGFRFSNSRPRSFRAAAAMVEAGGSPERVAHLLYERRRPASLRLLAESLRSLELHAGGELATIALTAEMLDRAGAERDDSEGLIDHPRAIDGVRAVALFRELAAGDYKVSLRSRGEVDVAAVATRHGGGGHRNAAGCVVDGPLERARQLLVEELTATLEGSSER